MNTTSTGLAALAVAVGLSLGTSSVTASAAPTGSPEDRAVEALKAHPKAAKPVDGQEFTAQDVTKDASGATHVRMQRTLGGLPVIGGDLVVHTGPQGRWKGASQSLETPLDLGTTPRVSATEAVTTVRGSGLAAEDLTTRTDLGKGTLVVDATGEKPVLAWRVMSKGVQKDGTPSRLATYIDARTGEKLRSEQTIVNVDGEGNSLYSGKVKLNLTQTSSGYELRDPVNGNAAVSDAAYGTVFRSTDALFGNGTTSSRESAGVDAAYGAAQTFQYFKTKHGREGIWDNGTGAPSRVHYGQNYNNAFWDGRQMTYGDGDGSNFGPLVALDVAGHEMSHGVTENTAGLIYSGESGGLNEATSDIFGSMVEFYSANPNDRGDYLIGERFDLRGTGGFRRMDQPSRDGGSLDCWSPDASRAEVHRSSGIGNHFFYLLSEGSGAKTLNGVSYNSPTCNGSSVTGIGRGVAAKIWFRALNVYMTSSTNYAGARTATLRASTDLFGANSERTRAVAAAWSAVNVG